jgi:TonB-linked SusC/RagA family outer membrane protein
MKKLLCLFLLLTGLTLVAAAQSPGRRTLGGVIKTEKGEGLPGATIVVKGTTNGITSNADGSFSLSIPAAGEVALLISSVGFESQTIAVGERTTLNITLKDESKALDDVVVIGYEAVNRRDVTGSVSSVSAQQIKDIPVNSAADALAGRLAGVQVTSSEGAPGSDVRIRVRGGGSITQDNSPLYIVDGVQVENALSVISPQDIASVDVLKDAASTAIYGARGANGVIIITTKNGREGRTVVSYNGFAGVRKIAKTLKLLSPSEFLSYQYERALGVGATNAGGLNDFRKAYGSSNFTGDTLNADRNQPVIDWQKEVFGQQALMQTHNISVSGGTKATTYSLSLTRNDEQGIQIESGFTRNLLNFRFDHKASDKFRLGFNVRYNDQEIKGAGTASGGQSSSSRLRNTVQYRPFQPAYGSGASIDIGQLDDAYFALNGGVLDPIQVSTAEYRRNLSQTTNLNGYFSFAFTKSLLFRSTVGFDNLTTTQNAFNSSITSIARQNGNAPTANITTGGQQTLNNSNVLTYNIKKEHHSFDALLGQEFYQYKSNSQYIETRYLPTDITPEQALANINQGASPAGFVQPTPTTGQSLSRILSVFSRVNYSYDDKYLVTGTVRADGSSKFSTGNQIGFFPAASVAWRISQEKFMKSLTQVSDLKLRFSYGLAGNNRIGDFLYTQNFLANGIRYGLNENLTPGLASTNLAYPDLRWETTLSRNIGLDLSLFDNRVQVTVDAYQNTTRDLLINLPITSTSGYTSQLQNIGRTANRGLEFQVSGTVLRTKNFSWTANANISFNRNKVEDIGPQPYILQNSGWTSDTGSDYLVQVGQPVGLMYGYITDGFYKIEDFTATQGTTGAYTYKLKEGIASNANVLADNRGVQPGTLKFKDYNGDGIINTNDRAVIGNANPKHTGGFNQQFTFKSFDASIFLNWSYGNSIYNANKIDFTSSYYSNLNMLDVMSGRFRNINDQGVLVTEPTALAELNKDATIWTPTRGRYLLHSWAVEDGSFLRINNVTIGYSLPKALIQRIKLSQVRVYVTGNNLYTFTKYSGYDPEVNTRRGTPLTPGVDYAAYPRSRALLFGLNLSL